MTISIFLIVSLCIKDVVGSDVYTDLGSTTTLVCPFKPDPFQDMRWAGPPNYSVMLSIGSGINPTLPNERKSRLSITGNVTIREYNLKITNIQQSDAGGYRCNGISGGSSLFEDINLRIQVAPLSSPVISVDPTGNIIAGSNVKFTCSIPGGTPLATISWECPGSGQPESGSNLSTAVSTVQFVVNKNDNGKMCQCIGSHSLWTPHRTANITMDIKYAPSNSLSITQIPDGGILINNQKDIKLTCTVTGGYPLATLHWNCDGIKTNESTGNTASYSVTFVVNKTYNNRICTCSATHIVPSYRPSVGHTLIVFFTPENDPIIIQKPPGYIIAGTHIILTCEVSGGNPLAILSWNCTGTTTNITSANKASYSVQLDINRNFHTMICACSATHMVMSYRPIVRHVLLVAYIPKNNPVIKQVPEGGVIAGEKVTLLCTVSGGYPLATLTWDCQGNKINNTIGTTVSYSVEIIADKNYNNRTCTCSAAHFITSYKPQTQHRLIVFYVPDGNLIVKQMPQNSIIIHHKVTLMCSISGGNPLATLSWNCTGIFTNSTIPNLSSYSVEFIVKQNDNNRFCTCKATHIIPSYRKQVHHQLVVYYGPVNVPSIRQNPNGGIINGNSVTLTCEVSGGNPLVTLMWNCSGPTLNNTAGNKASYSVVISVDKKDNKKICACSTMHPDPSYQHTIQHVLDVLFGPSSPRLVPDPMMPWFEGNVTSLKCIYEEGNPVGTIEWKRENNVQSDESNPIFDLGMVSKDDLNSSIICVVSNKYGTVESEVVYLEIEYYPRIEIVKKKFLTIKGDNFAVSCSATGNPLPSVSWSEFSNDFMNATISKSVLSIEDIDRRHDGNYTCKAKSKSAKYGILVTEEDILVVVYYAPEKNPVIQQTPSGSIISGTEIVLTCTVYGGNPLATLTWNCTGVNINSTAGHISSNSVTFTVDKTFNNQTCTCSAIHPIISYKPRIQLTLNVYFKPFLDTTSFNSPEEIAASENDNLLITVSVKSNPHPIIQWTFIAQDNIDGCHNSSINSTNQNDGLHSSSNISIDSLKKNQFGQYTFMATNVVGIFRRKFSVLENGKPMSPSYVHVLCKSTTAILIFKPSFNGNLQQEMYIQYTVDGQVMTSIKVHINDTNQPLEYLVTGLSPGRKYNFSILAVNPFGETRSNQVKCLTDTLSIGEDVLAFKEDNRSMFSAGIASLVLGLLFFVAATIFIFRKRFKKTYTKSYKSDEYSDLQTSNPAFQDPYTSILNPIESRHHQEPIANTYEECGNASDAAAYQNIENMESGHKKAEKNMGIYDNMKI